MLSDRLQRQLDAEVARVNARLRGERAASDSRQAMERAYREGDERAQRFSQRRRGPGDSLATVERQRS